MVLILAAGRSKQWHDERCRHLVPIAGEPLLVRTLRELKERGREATVVTDNQEIMEAIPGCFAPKRSDMIWRTMFSTKKLWKGRVLVMLGDVFYRDDMYDLMFSYQGKTPACFDSFACVWAEKDYGHVIRTLRQFGGTRKYFNLLWREGHFLKVPCAGHTDFDVVAYYEQFLEANPWARSDAREAAGCAAEAERRRRNRKNT